MAPCSWPANDLGWFTSRQIEHRVLSDGDVAVRIEQGHQVRRPSLVLLRARRLGASREIHVGGAVIQTVRGELL